MTCILAGRVVCDEERIVTEATLPLWRAEDASIHFAVLDNLLARRRTQCDRADELRRTPFVCDVAQLTQHEVIVGLVPRARPTRRKHAGHPVESVDAQAGIVGERRQTGGLQAGPRLDQRIALKRRFCLRGFVERFDVVKSQNLDVGDLWREYAAEFGQFLPVAGGEDDFHFSNAACCSRVRSAQPFSASASSESSSSRPNAAPSAVPWISTNFPPPVMTTFISVSARTSST